MKSIGLLEAKNEEKVQKLICPFCGTWAPKKRSNWKVQYLQIFNNNKINLNVPNLPNFWNLANQNITDRQHSAHFRKSQKSATSLHPTLQI